MKSVKIIAFLLSVLFLMTSCTFIVPIETKTSDKPPKPTNTEITSTATSDKTSEPTAEPTAPITAEPTATPTAEPTEPAKTEEPHIKTVLLDPGHGFIDGGCAPEALAPMTEAQVNVKFVMAVKAQLEAYGYRVVLTHDGVTFPSCAEIAAKCDKYGVEYDPFHPTYWVENSNFDIYERSVWSNVLEAEYDCDMFISFHVDSYPQDASIRGSSVYYCTENDYSAESQRAVMLIDKAIRNAFPDRRVHTEGFKWDDAYAVTKYPKMPSMLIEVGYGTNPEDADLMKGDTWADEFASAVVSAVMTFLG